MNNMITAAEANKQAKENVELNFDDVICDISKKIEWAVSFGRVSQIVYIDSFLMREKVAKHFENLGYSISYPDNEDYDNKGCHMIIYWG